MSLTFKYGCIPRIGPLILSITKQLQKSNWRDFSYITSEGEIENTGLSKWELVTDILWRPIQITLLEALVLLIDIFIGLVYAVMYLWFEAFPIVFMGSRNWELIPMGIAYLSIIVGVLLGAAVYFVLILRGFTLPLLRSEKIYPEVFLPSAILGSVLMPIGIFVFGWSSTKQIHWIVSLLGAAIFGASGFLIFNRYSIIWQCHFQITLPAFLRAMICFDLYLKVHFHFLVKHCLIIWPQNNFQLDGDPVY